jgi:uncharacterized membrane protein YjjP (DUF1212 family)
MPSPRQSISSASPMVRGHSAEQVALLLELGRCLHSAGAPTRRLELTLTEVAARMQLRIQVFSAVTSLIVSFGPYRQLSTTLLRLDPGDFNLGRLIRLDEVVHQFLWLGGTQARLHRDLMAIRQMPDGLGPMLGGLSRGLGAAAWCVLLGGHVREAIAGALAGGAVGALTNLRRSPGASADPRTAVSAILAGAIVVASAASFGPLSVEMVSLAAVLPLLPGLPLVVGVEEVASKDLLAGAARLIAVALTFLQVAFGMALGTRFALYLVAVAPSPSLHVLPLLAQVPLLLLILRILALHFRVERKDLPWVFIAGTVGFASARMGTTWLGVELGAFVGALIVGCTSNAVARWLNRPALLVSVPGMFSLWPGGMGLQCLDDLWSAELLRGIQGAFSVAMIAVGAVTGLLVASSVLPPRRAL